ncbi:hypothetical protein NDN08_005882 [Rhodosorus marinus]|uniref:Pentacotripeptide-repeat region of PRORP domain-containing protein n=1 Tax=Rhodosorus marinus TaxID=101924 RepID=A0AAV8V3F3_9RHOD|nr:hypothetical protein NDN08_005882 [Rhodosorus marinus]
MVDETMDRRRTGEVFRDLEGWVEERTSKLPLESRDQVRRARIKLAHLKTEVHAMGYGMTNVGAVVAISKTFEMHGEAERIRYLLQCLALEDIAPPPEVFCAYISSFLIRNENEQAAQALEELLKKGFRPSPEMATRLIRRFAQSGCQSALDRLFETMGQDAAGKKAAMVSVLAHKNGSLKDAVALFQALEEYNEDALTDLLSQMTYASGLREIRRLLNASEPMSLLPFKALARANPRRAEDVFSVALESGLKLDEDAYTLLIENVAQRGNLERSRELLDELVLAVPILSQGAPFHRVIDLCVRKGDLESARQFLSELAHSHICPDAETYRLVGLVHESKLAPAEEVEEHETSFPIRHHNVISAAMRRLNVDGESALGSVLKALGSVNDIDRMTKVYEDSVQRGWNLKPHHVLLIMEAYSAREDYASILKLLKAHVDVQQWSAEELAKVILLCAKSETAEEVKRMASRRGLGSASAVTFALFRSICSRGDIVRAEAALKNFESDDEEDFLDYLRLLKPRGQSSMIDSMISGGIRVTSLSYDIVLETLIDNDMSDLVPRVVERMRRERVKPSARTFEQWTRAAVALNDPRMALTAYRAMQVNSFELTYPTLANLVQACVNAEEIDAAVKIIERVAVFHEPFAQRLRLVLLRGLLDLGMFSKAITLEFDLPLLDEGGRLARKYYAKPGAQGRCDLERPTRIRPNLLGDERAWDISQVGDGDR